MSDKTPFIQEILIRKVRHLKNLTIPIDSDRCRSLILTGPNGCGKTSVLNFLCNYLEGIPNGSLLNIKEKQNDLSISKKQITELEALLLATNLHSSQKVNFMNLISNHKENVKAITQELKNFECIEPTLSNLPEMVESYQKGEFLIAFFDAKRQTNIQSVDGAMKFEHPKISPIQKHSLAPKFLQFLVNQENRSANLLKKGDKAGAKMVDDWMKNITQRFRSLFKNDKLELVYDFDNFDFTILMPGREPFRLVDNQLSDGFSSVIQIIAELLLRMDAVSAGKYDMPGIVLIDEIETHLHIELQKEILPFLTDFFPKIQFIVTTHSPFVLTSLPDSVVFDLENHKRWVFLAPLSASAIIEDYFDSNLYSAESMTMIDRYNELSGNIKRSQDEENEFIELRKKLDSVDFEQSPELVAHYKHLRAKERGK